MHISEKVEQALIADGWELQSFINAGDRCNYQKRIENFAPAGTVSNGARVVTLRIDQTGRWLERVDGWGKVERDVDLRRFDDAATAIQAVLS